MSEVLWKDKYDLSYAQKQDENQRQKWLDGPHTIQLVEEQESNKLFKN